MKINKPHDSFIKSVLSKRENAIDFFKNYLPETIVEKIDFDSLYLDKDSFVEKELQPFYSDIIFKLKLNNRPSILYILFEHKSQPEKLVAFQLLNYKIKMYQKILKMNKDLQKFPQIIGYVFYHGKKKWKAPTQFKDIIDYDPALEEYIIDFKYVLNNISLCRDDDIRGQIEIKATLFMMKHIFDTDLENALSELADLIRDYIEYGKHQNYFESMLRYIFSKSQIKPEKVKQVFDRKNLKRGGELVMSTAETLIQQGIEKGIKKGIEQNQKTIITLMYGEGISAEQIHKLTKIPLQKIIEILDDRKN